MTNTTKTSSGLRVLFIADDNGSDNREIEAGETGVLPPEISLENLRDNNAIMVTLDKDKRYVAAWAHSLKVIDPADLKKVRAGDTVTVRVRSSMDPNRPTWTITGEAWAIENFGGSHRLFVGDVALDDTERVMLLEHEPAERLSRVSALWDYVTQQGDEELLEGLVAWDPEDLDEDELIAQVMDDEVADSSHAVSVASVVRLTLSRLGLR